MVKFGLILKKVEELLFTLNYLWFKTNQNEKSNKEFIVYHVDIFDIRDFSCSNDEEIIENNIVPKLIERIPNQLKELNLEQKK